MGAQVKKERQAVWLMVLPSTTALGIVSHLASRVRDTRGDDALGRGKTKEVTPKTRVRPVQPEDQRNSFTGNGREFVTPFEVNRYLSTVDRTSSGSHCSPIESGTTPEGAFLSAM
jgi:hypothetical protein